MSEAPKYEFTGETKIVLGVTLKRIRSVRVFGLVASGTLGGWIECEANLSVSGNAWVSGNAQVSGNAWVYGNAQVSGDARVSGNAQVSGNAWVYGDAKVYGNAQVYGDARVYGNAQVYGDAQVSGDAKVSCPITSATRSDGYTFTLTHDKDGTLLITAGCRGPFTPDEARAHWKWRAGTPLGAETDSILDHFNRMAAAGALSRVRGE